MGMKPKDGECPKSEPIKGEIGKDKKVYHVPDSKGYKKINPATCFTSVSEAKKAGFRAPRSISEILQEHLKDGKF
jgi:micrococcal nuclease